MNQHNRNIVRQSILDRLIRSDEPEPKTWEASLKLFKENLLRDLEWLLNTRESGSPATARYPEVERSIYNYGLVDFASMSADVSATPARLMRDIEREIELFEPRLTQVKVYLVEEGKTRRIQFVIEATARLDPDPEQIEFDSVMEFNSGRFRVES